MVCETIDYSLKTKDAPIFHEDINVFPERLVDENFTEILVMGV